MASSQRYIAVATSEDSAQDPQPVRLTMQSPPPEPVTLVPDNGPQNSALNQAIYVEIPPDLPPPPYESSNTNQNFNDQDSTVHPPAYEVASKLPTYEEAEGVRELNQDLEQRNAILLDGGQEVTLGNDWIFLMCFTLAFVFNWLGFFAAYCLTRTIASRYGAIAGFGLSLVKWVLIFQEAAKNNQEPVIYGQDWLWWIFFALGWLMFIRAVLAYIYIKMLVKKGCRRFPRTWGLSVHNK